MQLSGVRLSVYQSVCLSVPFAAGLLLQAQRPGDIDRLLHGRRSAAAANVLKTAAMRAKMTLGVSQLAVGASQRLRQLKEKLCVHCIYGSRHAVIDRRLRLRCCHLGCNFKRSKSSLERVLVCAQFIAKPKVVCALRTSSNLSL